MPWSFTDETSIAPHLAQEPWLKEGPKECLQDEKDVGYEICFGLWLPPLFTELVEACSIFFPCGLSFIQSLDSIFSTSDFLLLACLPSRYCIAMPHLELLAKASLECFLWFVFFFEQCEEKE